MPRFSPALHIGITIGFKDHIFPLQHRDRDRGRSGDSVDEPRDSDQHPDHAHEPDNSHERAQEDEKSPERSRPQNLASEKL